MERQFDQIFDSQANAFIQLATGACLPAWSRQDLNGHNLLPFKTWPPASRSSAPDWPQIWVPVACTCLPSSFISWNQKMQILPHRATNEWPNSHALIISYGRQTQRRLLLPMLIVARTQLTAPLFSPTFIPATNLKWLITAAKHQTIGVNDTARLNPHVKPVGLFLGRNRYPEPSFLSQ